METKLLPCPLCGGKVTAIETHMGRGELYCGTCDLSLGGSEAKTPEEFGRYCEIDKPSNGKELEEVARKHFELIHPGKRPRASYGKRKRKSAARLKVKR